MAGGCSAKFGDPQTLRTFGERYLEVASGLDEVVQELRQAVRGVVPSDWSGRAATAFKQHVEEELKGATEAAQTARAVGQAALTAAGKLAACHVMEREAEALALSGGYFVDDICWVRPLPGSTNTAAGQAAAYRADALLREAERDAFSARQVFRNVVATVQQRNQQWFRILMNASGGGVGMAGGMRPAGTARPAGAQNGRPIRPTLEQLQQAHANSEIVYERPRPAVEETRRSEINLGRSEPEAARIGREFHQMMANADRPFVGQKLGNSEWEVMGVDQQLGDVRRPDFVIVNHSTRQVAWIDYVTGPSESLEHNIKGWNYQTVPEIKTLIDQGYEPMYVPVVVPKIPN